MKTRNTLFILSIVLLFALASCSTNNPGFSTPVTPTAPDEAPDGTTDTTATEAFSARVPEDDATNVEVTPEELKLTWEVDPSVNAVSYTVTITEVGNTSNIIKAEGLTEPNYTHTARLSTATEYQWQVTATDPTGNSTESDAFNFTTRNLRVTQITAGGTGSPNFTARQRHTSVVFKEKLWVIAGTTSGRTDEVWSSEDGITWTQLTIGTKFTSRSAHTSVVFMGKLWVIGGTNQALTNLNDVWSSSDGDTWAKEPATAPFTSIRERHTSVVFEDKLWVIAGSNSGSNRFNDVWSSGDGATWTKEKANNDDFFTKRDSHSSVVFKDKIWLIGGDDLENGRINDVWSSSDGATWTEVTAGSSEKFTKRSDHTSVVFEDKLWIIGGRNR